MPITPQFPTPVPPWYRWGTRVLPAVWAAAEALLDTSNTADEAEELQWRRLVLVWQRATPTGTSEDEAMFTFDFVNITGGSVDTTWTLQDYQAVEGAFDTLMATVRTFQSSGHTLIAYRWYQMQFASPMLVDRRFLPTGPPVRIVPKNLPGTSANDALPYQVAFSVTERTSIPRHWGRFYLPGASEGVATGPWGRFQSTTIQAIADSVALCYFNLQNAELFPVVVSTQAQSGGPGSESVLGGTLLGVTNIQVDDIPDVIRRRRPRQPNIRTVLPALPAPTGG